MVSNLDAPSTDAQCDLKGHNKRSVEDIYNKGVNPVSPSAAGIPPTGGTRTQPSRSCKSRDNSPSSSAPKTKSKVTMDKKQMNRLTASVSYGNVFCALAFITFAAMITQGDPEWILPVSYTS